jgi:hypothetical protein
MRRKRGRRDRGRKKKMNHGKWRGWGEKTKVCECSIITKYA